jgi:hypothetical protein
MFNLGQAISQAVDVFKLDDLLEEQEKEAALQEIDVDDFESNLTMEVEHALGLETENQNQRNITPLKKERIADKNVNQSPWEGWSPEGEKHRGAGEREKGVMKINKKPALSSSYTIANELATRRAKKLHNKRAKAKGVSLDFWGTSDITSDLASIMSSATSAVESAPSANRSSTSRSTGVSIDTEMGFNDNGKKGHGGGKENQSENNDNGGVQQGQERDDLTWSLFDEDISQRVMSSLWNTVGAGTDETIESFFASSDEEEEEEKKGDKEGDEDVESGVVSHDTSSRRSKGKGKGKGKSGMRIDPIIEQVYRNREMSQHSPGQGPTSILGSPGSPVPADGSSGSIMAIRAVQSPADLARQRLYQAFNDSITARNSPSPMVTPEKISNDLSPTFSITSDTTLTPGDKGGTAIMYTDGQHDCNSGSIDTSSRTMKTRHGLRRMAKSLKEVLQWLPVLFEAIVFVVKDIWKPLVGTDARDTYDYTRYTVLLNQKIALTKMQKMEYRQKRARSAVLECWETATAPKGLVGVTGVLLVVAYFKFKRYGTDTGEE